MIDPTAVINPGVDIFGNVTVGARTIICGPGTDINGNHSEVVIGEYCDIAAQVTISCADSHRRCVGLSDDIERKPIHIGSHVFIGQGAKIFGGCVIGDFSVIGAGVVLKNRVIPPHSRVHVQEPVIEEGYYFTHGPVRVRN